MSYALTVNGLRVAVTVQDGARASEVVAGDMARAFDGTLLRIDLQIRKEEWPLVTTPLTQAEADALLAQLRLTTPLTCSGDLFRGATLLCHAVVKDRRPVRTSDSLREVLEFDLLEI